MPVRYTIDGDVLRLDFVGQYEPEEITARFLEAVANPACPDPVHLLVDVSASEVITSRTEYQIRQVAMALRPHADRVGHRCAVVAGTEAQFGIGLRGSVYSQGIGVEARVFRNVEAAVAWLRGDAAPS